ncbi:TIGR03759 family integrating conjugative element protein [uncultured Porticoccus sp.]|uniref:TIGR03759 family integrating conjugative element protein n=1 Tax=uncultured Porticoccus sp. TaxID=1256050 RepID=UPI002610135A|nr:TIGR03759 family integrating conjugative element protein [uncultured Porticoccus sp.]
MRSHITPVLAALIALAPVLALAQTAPATGFRIVSSQERMTNDTALDERLAKDWGLKPEEWTRYQQLMQGPLGIYSPNLDPLTVLGIEARDEEERRRYAELQVQAEARRVEKLLTYQRAYDAAWQRLYPNLLRVDMRASSGLPQSSLQPTRLAVFVKENCPACERRVRQLQTEGAEFDLYLVDSRQEDARVRQWAERVGIEPDKVRDRAITLNHDNGRWLAIGVQGELPAVVREVGGQWQRL